jgi:hypothetical protein
MPKKLPPRRLTPAEADALNAHLSPAQQAAILADLLNLMRANGVDARVVRDANGRPFVKIDMEALRERIPALAALYDELHDIQPLPAQPKGIA